jgi:hypothetical protein
MSLQMVLSSPCKELPTTLVGFQWPLFLVAHQIVPKQRSN